MPISETPKKIEFMMMNDSAAEFVMANNVAFIDSEDSCQSTQIKVNRAWRNWRRLTYDSFLFDDVDSGVDVVLGRQGYSQKRIHDAYCSAKSG